MSAPVETKGCGCITRMNAALAPHNTRLAQSFSVTSDNRLIAQLSVETVKVDSKLRKRPLMALAAFCPFCGVKATS